MVMAPSVLTPDDVYVFNNYHPHTKDPTLVTHLDIDHGENDALVLRDHSSPKELILKELKKRVAQIDITGCEPGEEDAFYVADLGEVYRQHMRWKMNLSRVKPFYGMFVILVPSCLILKSCYSAVTNTLKYSGQVQP